MLYFITFNADNATKTFKSESLNIYREKFYSLNGFLFIHPYYLS